MPHLLSGPKVKRVNSVSAVLTVGLALVGKPEDWRWSSDNNSALERGAVQRCPIQIDDVRLPQGYRG
jgi:hypothetical protein